MTESSQTEINDLRTRAIGDLREFIKAAESQGDLKIIEGADPHLEMGAIYELSLENLYPPVLLFRKMKGCDPSAQIIMNVRTSKFMVGDLNLEAVKLFRQKKKNGKPVTPIPPENVATGPIFDNVITGTGATVTTAQVTIAQVAAQG